MKEGIKNEKIKMKGGDRSSAKESEDSTKEEAHTAEIELLGLFAHSYQATAAARKSFARLGRPLPNIQNRDVKRESVKGNSRHPSRPKTMVDIPDLAQTFRRHLLPDGHPFPLHRTAKP